MVCEFYDSCVDALQIKANCSLDTITVTYNTVLTTDAL